MVYEHAASKIGIKVILYDFIRDATLAALQITDHI